MSLPAMYASDSEEEEEDGIYMKPTTVTNYGCVQKDLGTELHPSHDVGFEDKVFTTEAQGSHQGDNEKKGCVHVHAQVMGSKLIDHHDIELKHSMNHSVLTLEDKFDGDTKIRRGDASMKSSTNFERLSATQRSVESKHQSYVSWETFAKAWLT